MLVAWVKNRKALVPALQGNYRARDAEAGTKALEHLKDGDWSTGAIWSGYHTGLAAHWQYVAPFFADPESVCPLFYTPDAIEEGLNLKLPARPQKRVAANNRGIIRSS